MISCRTCRTRRSAETFYSASLSFLPLQRVEMNSSVVSCHYMTDEPEADYVAKRVFQKPHFAVGTQTKMKKRHAGLYSAAGLAAYCLMDTGSKWFHCTALKSNRQRQSTLRRASLHYECHFEISFSATIWYPPARKNFSSESSARKGYFNGGRRRERDFVFSGRMPLISSHATEAGAFQRSLAVDTVHGLSLASAFLLQRAAAHLSTAFLTLQQSRSPGFGRRRYYFVQALFTNAVDGGTETRVGKFFTGEKFTRRTYVRGNLTRRERRGTLLLLGTLAGDGLWCGLCTVAVYTIWHVHVAPWHWKRIRHSTRTRVQRHSHFS